MKADDDDSNSGEVGRQIKDTSYPRTAFLPPHIPVWRSTSAGRFPGRGRKQFLLRLSQTEKQLADSDLLHVMKL